MLEWLAVGMNLDQIGTNVGMTHLMNSRDREGTLCKVAGLDSLTTEREFISLRSDSKQLSSWQAMHPIRRIKIPTSFLFFQLPVELMIRSPPLPAHLHPNLPSHRFFYFWKRVRPTVVRMLKIP
jgi:hypothetical protein